MITMLQVWLQRKQYLLAGRQALARLDPQVVSLHHKKSLRVGRALRALSGGGNDLLPVGCGNHNSLTIKTYIYVAVAYYMTIFANTFALLACIVTSTGPSSPEQGRATRSRAGNMMREA